MLFLFLFSIGCRYKLIVQTSPSGADVTLNNNKMGPAPVETHFWSVPFQETSVYVEKEGYRPIKTTVTLKRQSILRWKKPKNQLSFILIKNHGPVGTWTPEDALSP
ncbi:MAG: hypothetical protein CMK59_01445 [Proteobacteria bacterium]|nr:hypothetical protein [Pseudomonadota bacterium]